MPTLELLQPTTAPKLYGHLFAEIDKGEGNLPIFRSAQK